MHQKCFVTLERCYHLCSQEMCLPDT